MAMRQVLNLLLCGALTLGAATSSLGAGHPGDPSTGAYLGVMVEKVSPEMASSLHLANAGALIENVDQDGPACRAGLKGGDVVTAFNGKAVTNPDQFAGFIHASAPGSTVTLTVVRNGQSRDMKVTLGDWKQMASVPAPPPPRTPLNPVVAAPVVFPPIPPVPAVPEVDVHIMTPMAVRSGIIVEPLSSQLGEYFGVPPNRGVLVRTVEKGSPGANAGLKAGDVIVRVNNEQIHDMADWKRALKAQSGKVAVVVIRDKKEQSLQMSLPGNTSKLDSEEWRAFEQQMEEFSAQMNRLGPQFEQQAREMAKLDPKQLEAIHKQVEESVKAAQPEMKRQAEELAKQSKEIQKQAEQISKDWAKMAPEWEQQAREMAEQIKPSAEEIKKMTQEWERQWKEQQPVFQKQMDELKKQLDQQMKEWQKSWQQSHPNQL
ncbi:MAG TPA: PDZ domain-containing protein [Candidatus Binatia bacterium]|nr:PDZ domain-containing protein [Candidatus Binatia bacterium]